MSKAPDTRNYNSFLFALPPGEVITSRAHGPDFSKYDLRFTPKTATGQIDFCVQRIGYGLVRDELFDLLLPGTLEVEIKGGYHYLNSGIDWKMQADRFLSYVAGLPFDFYVSDFEGYANSLSDAFGYACWRWIDYVQQKTGKPTILYTGRYLYQDYLIPGQKKYGVNWNNIELWQAEYPFSVNVETGKPTQPTGRTRPWKLWQYTSKANGTKYGLGRTSAGDLNLYNGTVTDMRAWLGKGTPSPNPEPPPPTGGSMEKYEVIGKEGLNLRMGPGTTFSIIRLIPTGSFVWGTPVAGVTWMQGVKFQEPGKPEVTQNFYCSTLASIVKPVTTTPPPVETLPDWTVTFEAPGYPVTKVTIKPL